MDRRGRGDIWIEQCLHDVLHIAWNNNNMTNNNDNNNNNNNNNINEFFLQQLAHKRPIALSFYCCQQFLLSKSMVHKRPLSTWKALLHVINEQDVCHEGALQLEQLYSYRYVHFGRLKEELRHEPPDIPFIHEEVGR